MKILYSDAHCHSNPVKGLGASVIARKFRESGGWFIGLVALPPYHYGFSEPGVDSYEKTVRLLIKENHVIREAGLKSVVLSGFHPAEVDEYVRKGLSLKEVVELANKVFDLIARYARQGFIHGIGEVGRQHYSTSPERIVASELIMVKALEVARDHDLFVHLHLEQGGWATVESITRLIKAVNIRRDRVFLHHVSYETGLWCERNNLWYTIPGKLRDLKKTLPENRGYVLVESDFIDDPRRPGVSSYPWDIPVNVQRLVNEELVDQEYVYKVMVDHVVEAYGVEAP